MITKKSLTIAALALTLPMLTVSTGQAAPLAPVAASASAAASQDMINVQYRRGWGGRGYYRRGGWGWGGAAAGLAAGALIGGAIAASQAPYAYGYGPGYYAPPPGYAVAPAYAPGGDAVAYCMQRYKSYDPASGTYLNYDGNRYPCP